MFEFQQFERPRFFTGKLLTADDLTQEQDYFRGKSRLHNRLLHGWGIVSGLNVTIDAGATVVVTPGLAIDCAGNELVLPAPEQITLSGQKGRHYVTIRYQEVLVGQQPSQQGQAEYSRVTEAVRVELAGTNPVSGHKGIGPGSPGCGHEHALCLATLRLHGTHWRVTSVERSRLHRK